MGTITDILKKKGPHALAVGLDASVFDAIVLMNERNVGAVAVTQGAYLIGIFTERDLLRRVAGEKRDPTQTCVSDVMTREVCYCTETTTIEEARSIMNLNSSSD